MLKVNQVVIKLKKFIHTFVNRDQSSLVDKFYLYNCEQLVVAYERTMEAGPKVETSETKNYVPDKPQDNSTSRKKNVSNAGHSATIFENPRGNTIVGFSGSESDNLHKDATKSKNLIKNANCDKFSSESKSGVSLGWKRDN